MCKSMWIISEEEEMAVKTSKQEPARFTAITCNRFYMPDIFPCAPTEETVGSILSVLMKLEELSFQWKAKKYFRAEI